jgi:hypothetical protein
MITNDNNYIIATNDNILNIKLNYSFQKIAITNNNSLLAGLENDTIIFYDIINNKKINELEMNLGIKNKIILIKFSNDNNLIIGTNQGNLYYYVNKGITFFNDIPNISTNDTIKDISLSIQNDYIAVLSNSMCFLYFKDMIIHLDNIEISQIKKIKFSEVSNNLLFLISDNFLILYKLNNLNQNKYVTYTTTYLELSDIIDISFTKLNKNIVLVNTKKESYIYIFNKTAYTLICKMKNYKSILSNNSYELYYLKNNKLEMNNYKDNIIAIIINILNESKPKNEIINLKYINSLMNNEVLQYDYSLEVTEIDYTKKIHLFIFLSKVPYFFNYYKTTSSFGLRFPINHKNLPTPTAIDQFINFIYTDILPDANIIYENRFFFKTITDKLWYGENNKLKSWTVDILKECLPYNK